MKSIFKNNLPILLLLLFELAVGVLLLIDGFKFTTIVFIIFGTVLMLGGLVLFIRYMKESKEAEKAAKEADSSDNKKSADASIITLITAIAAFVLGAVFAFGSGMLVGLEALLLVFYGAIMLVKGGFKFFDFFSLRKEGLKPSPVRIIGALFSIILAIVIFLKPFGALNVLFIVTGIALIFEAAIDIATIVFTVKAANELEVEAKEIEDDKPYDLKNFE